MITFIILTIIGWSISFFAAIKGMIVGWKTIDKDIFTYSFKLFILSIPGGWVIGWILLAGYIKGIWVDKHFDK